MSLLWSVCLAVLAGLLGVAIVMSLLHLVIPTSTKQADPIDVTKISLSVVAGVGGVVALVVAYRRQRDLEQGRFVERFGAAAAQLGNVDAAVRIAGVYAMAGVADESGGARRQQCIDVLCGYLRLPYSPDIGSNHPTKRIVKNSDPDGAAGGDEVHLEYRQNDRQVRKTISRVIREHLLAEAENSWSTCNFDFTAAYFEDADFRDAVFDNESTWFVDACFRGHSSSFGRAMFKGDHVRFDDATFESRRTMFSGATFAAKDTSFRGVRFASEQTTFRHANFSGGVVTFRAPTEWRNVRFDWTESELKPPNVKPDRWPPRAQASTDDDPLTEDPQLQSE
ncbi:pentapeptide repeat-containing protein [Nocardia macrotermitis]|uniref:Pentapeptide repeat-containing protein n=1 Tax=Nocardia macrotermitis TaxID=2585198 RepID=A0A7K0DFC9_9NOCA|nr:hypothetical protein [Nocardia macrotermitis]MQY24359.1 hypothetical protein [Nocardia macrotermitis]